jgi:hypothetical protein
MTCVIKSRLRSGGAFTNASKRTAFVTVAMFAALTSAAWRKSVRGFAFDGKLDALTYPWETADHVLLVAIDVLRSVQTAESGNGENT